MLGEISKYIYDSDEVLDRLRKPPPAPGVHRRRTRTQTRPSPRFTQRLSAPGPMYVCCLVICICNNFGEN